MSTMWKSAWPLLAVLFVGMVVPVLLNEPHGAALRYVPLSMLLWASGWLYCGFSNVRRSAGAFTSGAAQFFLAVGVSVYPQLVSDIPAFVLGLGLTLLISMLIFPLTHRVYKWRTVIAVLIAGAMAALLPLLSTIRMQSFAPMLTSVAILAGVVTAIFAWQRRQSRGGISRVFTVAYFCLLFLAGAAGTFIPTLEPLVLTNLLDWLTIANVIIAAGFITDQLEAEKQLRSGPHMELEASYKDPLTGLANRRALEVYGPQLITLSHSSGRAISIIMADIDHFKRINDTHGHLVGDVVLKQTAAKFVAQVRKSDLVVRYGGEEFIIFLPGSPLAPALRLAEKIRTVIESETVATDGITLNRTVSFGVATAFPEEPMSLADLIRRADSNLYRAKREGRNTVRANELPAQDF